MNNILWQTIKDKKKSSPPPIWLMRQAGRYLPEYRAIRKTFPSFMSFCYTPEKAAEVTLQPLTRFNFDAAILFSDILTIPHALNQNVDFIQNEGPHLTPALNAENSSLISYDENKLNPIYETIKICKSKLNDTPLIGFSGAPWTLLTYMIEGKNTRNYKKTFDFLKNNPKKFEILLKKTIIACSDYLIKQIKAGVDLIKIFDSWAAYVPQEYFKLLIIEPTKQIIKNIKVLYPDVPIICFPKGVGKNYIQFCQEMPIDVIALDHTIDLEWAKANLPDDLTFQGNLDPETLLKGGNDLIEATENILETLHDKRFIFNLGHGVIKETPIENIELLINTIRK